MEKKMNSINSHLGVLEGTLKVLADLDRRFATTMQRIGGHEGGLISKGNPTPETQSDDLLSRLERNLNYFISLNESISQTLDTIDASLGIDTGAVVSNSLRHRPDDANLARHQHAEASRQKLIGELVGARPVRHLKRDERPDYSDEQEFDRDIEGAMASAADNGNSDR